MHPMCFAVQSPVRCGCCAELCWGAKAACSSQLGFLLRTCSHILCATNISTMAVQLHWTRPTPHLWAQMHIWPVCLLLLQIMLQPVVTPCGKTFEYEAVRRWITQHGKGTALPASHTALSYHTWSPAKHSMRTVPRACRLLPGLHCCPSTLWRAARLAVHLLSKWWCSCAECLLGWIYLLQTRTATNR